MTNIELSDRRQPERDTLSSARIESIAGRPLKFPLLSDDEGPIGIEELEARLCSLAPRAELVARMALRLRFYDIYDKKSYFACLAALIKELRLTAKV